MLRFKLILGASLFVQPCYAAYQILQDTAGNTVSVTGNKLDVNASISAANVSGSTVTISNFPAVQVVSGTVTVSGLSSSSSTTNTTNRLIWTSDTDWNKGDLGVDLEVSSGSIRPIATVVSSSDTYLIWHLNEASTGTINDSSLYGRNGITVAPDPYLPASFTAGQLNNALTLPGESEAASFVDGGDIAGFEWNVPFSLDCWVNMTAGYEFMHVAGKYNATEQKGWIFAIQSNYILFELVGSFVTENYIQVYSVSQITSGVFQHIGITYDGSGTAAGINMYINGVQETPSVYFDGLAETSIVPSSAAFVVGGDISQTGWGFIGKIDEVTLYTATLNQADIDFRYNLSSGTEASVRTQSVYKTSATYSTNVFDSGYLNQDWTTLNASLVLPSSTTISIKARASNDTLAMGAYGSPLTVGTSVGLTGQYIQFMVDFTGTTAVRSVMDTLSVLYIPAASQDINP